MAGLGSAFLIPGWNDETTVMAGLVPAIHVFKRLLQMWMAGTSSAKTRRAFARPGREKSASFRVKTKELTPR
jgi:hypothetical protein